jgi:hypothetical protein
VDREGGTVRRIRKHRGGKSAQGENNSDGRQSNHQSPLLSLNRSICIGRKKDQASAHNSGQHNGGLFKTQPENEQRNDCPRARRTAHKEKHGSEEAAARRDVEDRARAVVQVRQSSVIRG